MFLRQSVDQHMAVAGLIFPDALAELIGGRQRHFHDLGAGAGGGSSRLSLQGRGGLQDQQDSDDHSYCQVHPFHDRLSCPSQ